MLPLACTFSGKRYAICHFHHTNLVWCGGHSPFLCVVAIVCQHLNRAIHHLDWTKVHWHTICHSILQIHKWHFVVSVIRSLCSLCLSYVLSFLFYALISHFAPITNPAFAPTGQLGTPTKQCHWDFSIPLSWMHTNKASSSCKAFSRCFVYQPVIGNKSHQTKLVKNCPPC